MERGCQQNDRTLAALQETLAWRASIGADELLRGPPAAVTARHGAFRRIWHSDIYGQDDQGHPLYVLQLGKLVPDGRQEQ